MVDALRVQIPTLHGREAELKALDELLDRAAAGDGGAVAVRGDPGLGKTALLDHVAASADAKGFKVLRTKGVESERELAYAALARLIEPLSDGVQRLPHPQAAAVKVMLDGCTPEEKLALRLGVRALLTDEKLLCTVDDTHLLDAETLDVIGFVASRLRDTPAAIVMSSGTAGRIALRPLDEAAARQVLGDGIEAETAATLLKTAKGNPQALVELRDALTDAQRHGVDPPPDRLGADSPLRWAYQRRVESLSPAGRWLLLLAAADEELRGPELMRAARVSGVDIEELAPAERAGLVRVAQAVTFPQPLVRAIVYDSTPLAQRLAAHALLARTLSDPLRCAVHRATTTAGPDAALADELEHVATQRGYAEAAVALEQSVRLTGDPETAAVRLVAAARNAWLAGDPRRATALLHDVRLRQAGAEAAHQRDLLVDEIELRSRAAAVTLDALLEGCDRLADAHRELAALALLRAGEAVCFSGEHTRYAEIAQRARQLRRRREAPRIELMLSHVDGFAAVFLGHFPDAIEPLRRVVRIGMALRTVESLTAASSAALLLADIAGARTAAELAMQLARDDGDFCTSPLAHMMLTFAEFGLGRYSSAQRSATAGLAASRDARQDMYARDHLGLLAVLAAIHGEADECFRHLRELAAPPGAGRWSRPRALAQWALAAIDVQRGRSWAAVSRLTSLTSPDKRLGQTVIEILSTPWLVEAARTDDRPRAAAALAVFDAWSALSGNPVHHALSARCHALLAPRGAAADEWFERSLALHLSAEADFERARTELLYGQELRRTRRPKDARDHLHSALETFEQLDVASWANQARAELRGAGETVDAAPAPAARALTAQQLQIARLVVDGATNREVAARLYLSTRTVDHHMRNIFTRLGIRSRVELAKLL